MKLTYRALLPACLAVVLAGCSGGDAAGPNDPGTPALRDDRLNPQPLVPAGATAGSLLAQQDYVTSPRQGWRFERVE